MVEILGQLMRTAAGIAGERVAGGDRRRPASLGRSAPRTFALRRGLEQGQLDDAGQHEFLKWACLARAMDELGYHPEIVDFVESYVFNSSKCFAVFER
jgi:hypothetical protein